MKPNAIFLDPLTHFCIIGPLKELTTTNSRTDVRPSSNNSRPLLFEPETTPSILASIPDCFRTILLEIMAKMKKKHHSTLLSSNSLANRFIFERWGIRPSQRKRYRNLFTQVRKQSRAIFQHYLTRGRIEWTTDNKNYVFGVFKFDEIRGNLILGFVLTPPESEWKLPFR